MERIKNIKWKDVGVRALKTFVQAALAYAAVNVVLIKDKDTARTVVIGTVAAGISAVWNVVKDIVGW